MKLCYYSHFLYDLLETHTLMFPLEAIKIIILKK